MAELSSALHFHANYSLLRLSVLDSFTLPGLLISPPAVMSELSISRLF